MIRLSLYNALEDQAGNMVWLNCQLAEVSVLEGIVIISCPNQTL